MHIMGTVKQCLQDCPHDTNVIDMARYMDNTAILLLNF